MPALEPSKPRPVVLIADDKPNNRELLRAILESANYNVIEAADGEEALLLASESNPHLMILDIHMPKRDGFAVISELRRDPVLQATPVMALTASASFDEKDRILSSGFDACFVKPIGPAKLRDAVASLLQQCASTS
jgi:CheY-like chemotaxis protein